MQRNLHTERDKTMLRLERERKQLRRQRDQMVPIDPPIQRGWLRRWRLTARAKLRIDVPVLATILAAINTEQHFWRRSFKRGKHARRRKFYQIPNQSPRELHEWDWQRLGWPEKWKQPYFRRRESTGWGGRHVVTYRFFRDDLIEFYTERHLISKLPLHQPEVERRYAEVEDALGHCGSLRLDSLHGRGKYHCSSHHDRENALRRRDESLIRRALLGDWEAEKNRLTYTSCQPLLFSLRSQFLKTFARVAQ